MLHLPKACFTDILKIEKECETRLLSAESHVSQGKIGTGIYWTAD